MIWWDDIINGIQYMCVFVFTCAHQSHWVPPQWGRSWQRRRWMLRERWHNNSYWSTKSSIINMVFKCALYIITFSPAWVSSGTLVKFSLSLEMTVFCTTPVTWLNRVKIALLTEPEFNEFLVCIQSFHFNLQPLTASSTCVPGDARDSESFYTLICWCQILINWIKIH